MSLPSIDEFNRRGHLRRILIAALAAVTYQVFDLSLRNLGTRLPGAHVPQHSASDRRQRRAFCEHA
jgi:hypothetical protein